jgi:hypothetical protein
LIEFVTRPERSEVEGSAVLLGLRSFFLSRPALSGGQPETKKALHISSAFFVPMNQVLYEPLGSATTTDVSTRYTPEKIILENPTPVVT